MTTPCHNDKPTRGMLVRAIASIAIVLLPIALSVSCSRGTTAQEKDLTFEVKRGHLTISVTEAGTIEAREQIILKNRVEGYTTILFLVPEGQRVKEGDLLVELDVSRLEEEKLEQEIVLQNAEASFIHSREGLAVTKNQSQSDIDKATLAFAFAKQDLKKYIDGEHPNKLRELEAQITLKEEEVQRTAEEYKWSKILLKEKYLSDSELKADELAMKKAQLDLELARNNLELENNFTHKRQVAQLESDVKQTEMALERATRKASADIVQAEAELAARESELGRQKDKLVKVAEQIGLTKIHAPADGLVVYATSARSSWRGNAEPLEEGREVREREELIYLPTASSFMAATKVHESNLDKLSLDLPVKLTVDALPDKRLTGSVSRIAPLPDAASRWMNPDLKVYDTEIFINNEDEDLKTGMSCEIEIIVAQYDDALYVPVQCVLRVERKPTVFVLTDGQIEKRPVEIGMDNNRMVHILTGLEPGEQVLLSPPLAIATRQEDKSTDDQPEGGDSPQPAQTSAPAKKAPGAPGKPTNEQREAMRERFKNMTPEQREAAMKKLKAAAPGK